MLGAKKKCFLDISHLRTVYENFSKISLFLRTILSSDIVKPNKLNLRDNRNPFFFMQTADQQKQRKKSLFIQVTD